MNVAVVTAFHGRPKVSKLFWMNMDRCGVPVYAVCAEGDQANIDLCERHAAAFAVDRNHDVSDRFNTACRLAKGCDRVIAMGSDDLLDPAYLEQVRTMTAPHVFPDRIALYCTTTGQAHEMKNPLLPNMVKFGAGRSISAEALEAVSWSPWPKGHRKGLGWISTSLLIKRGMSPSVHKCDRPAVLDVKTNSNIWRSDGVPSGWRYPMHPENAMHFLDEAERNYLHDLTLQPA